MFSWGTPKMPTNIFEKQTISILIEKYFNTFQTLLNLMVKFLKTQELSSLGVLILILAPNWC